MEAVIKIKFNDNLKLRECVRLYNESSVKQIEITQENSNNIYLNVENTDQLFKLGQIYERVKLDSR